MTKSIVRGGLLFLSLISSGYSWNSLGHQLVAQIASNHLNPNARQTFDKYNQALDKTYGHRTLVNASPWLDSLRYLNDQWLRPMHYISLPFSLDGTALLPPYKVNAVFAIEKAVAVIKGEETSLYNKGFSLRVLLHVVGDIHQPMHAVSQYSSKFPKGDKGGNLVRLAKNAIANNLHAYWDNGGGFLLTKKKISPSQVKQKAKGIEQHWPCDPQLIVLKPSDWANESHLLAVNNAYTVKAWHIPNKAYQRMVREISEQQIALAGCRLASLLNSMA